MGNACKAQDGDYPNPSSPNPTNSGPLTLDHAPSNDHDSFTSCSGSGFETTPYFSVHSSRRQASAMDINNLFISPNEVQLKERIGSGGSGVVRRGVWRGTDVAVKQLFINQASGEIDKAEMEVLQHEAAVFASLRHPNVALFLGACLERPTCFIVTQLYPKGSLFDLLNNRSEELDWEIKVSLAGDAARGLHYLHTFNPPIIHRDVKSSNILIDGEAGRYVARITDFGLTKYRVVNTHEPRMTTDSAAAVLHTTDVGTLRWTAPELLAATMAGIQLKEYSAFVDVYSFGIVLWEIAMRQMPYKSMKYNSQVEREVIGGKRPTSYPGCSPPGKLFWHEYGTPWALLMEACWSGEPAHRPSMEAVVERLERIASTSDKTPSGPQTQPAGLDPNKAKLHEPPRMGGSPRSLTAMLDAQDSKLAQDDPLIPTSINDEQDSVRRLRAEKDAALKYVAELQAGLRQQEHENAKLRREMRILRSGPQEESGNELAFVDALRSQLSITTQELDRVTALAKISNQQVNECQLEILALKKELKAARRSFGSRGASFVSTASSPSVSFDSIAGTPTI